MTDIPENWHVETGEGCTLGVQNKTRIDNMEKCVEKIGGWVEDLRNHYSNRLPTYATVLISVLTAAIGVLVGLLLAK